MHLIKDIIIYELREGKPRSKAGLFIRNRDRTTLQSQRMIRHRPCERVGMPCRDLTGPKPLRPFSAYHAVLPGGRVTPHFGALPGQSKCWPRRASFLLTAAM
jgi:hypothetical protein